MHLQTHLGHVLLVNESVGAICGGRSNRRGWLRGGLMLSKAAGRLNVFRRPAALSSWKNKVFFCIIAPLND